MEPEIILGCLLIILARITDVTLGTLRTIFVVNGRAGLAWSVGFVETLVWVYAVSTVIQNVTNPAYAVSYALGCATGYYVGIAVEKRLALGEHLVRIITRSDQDLARLLREKGYAVTEFTGRGRDGDVRLLLTKTRRRDVRKVLHLAGEVDPKCFYIADDIRLASSPAAMRQRSGGWRSVVKRK